MANRFHHLALVSTLLFSCLSFADESTHIKEVSLAPPTEAKVARKPAVKKAFSAFTGKITGQRVRLRLQPDVESAIVKELTKNDLISVVDEEGDFWAISAPEDLKAYVFRSFILDNEVQGNRVNIRLEPNLDAPIIGQLNAGDKVKGTVCTGNQKWLEINTPNNSRFFVAKEYVQSIGGPEVRGHLERRKSAVEQLLSTSALLCQSELKKAFDEIDFEQLKRTYQSIIQDYTDFPEMVERAREALASIQASYMQKRIAFLESKSAGEPTKREHFAAADAAQHVESYVLSDHMQMWQPLEEALYLSWSSVNEEKSFNEFYNEQKLAAVPLSGTLEAFLSPVKNKPGDFILKVKDLPVAYLYSTVVDLQHLVGKRINLLGSPRPNNNFAFPAYFVHSIE